MSNFDSFIGKKFGALKQLTVLRRAEDFSLRKYELHCEICAADCELYGDGIFYSNKENLFAGKLPCGCSKAPRLTENQYLVKLKRRAKELGFQFIELAEQFKGIKTRIIISTPYGVSSSTNIDNFLSRGTCDLLKSVKTTIRKIKSTEYWTKRFFDTGVFSENTKFERDVDRKFWFVTCGDCEEQYRSAGQNLVNGKQGCECSVHNGKFSYIILVYDTVPIAIKFGITKNPKARFKQISTATPLSTKLLYVFEFKNRERCKKAEHDCKKALICGVLSRELLPDGFTETTYINNLEEIMNIFNKYGGEIVFNSALIEELE